MSEFNEFVYKKVYLIEFSANSMNDCFAFSVPPENEEISQAQRVIETKTFGGIVYDDYGNDVINISLSGSTVNMEKRKALSDKSGASSIDYESGEDELQQLINLISKYGEHSNLKDKTINLYNLSNGILYENVLIKSFNYKRSKMSPLAYNYSIVFSYSGAIKKGVKLTQDYTNFAKTRIPEAIEEVVAEVQETNRIYQFCKDVKNNVDSVNNTVKEAIKPISAFYQSVTETMDTIAKQIDEVTKLISECLLVTTDLLGEFTGVTHWKEIYQSGTNILESAYRVVFDPPAQFYSKCVEFISSANEAIQLIKEDIDNGILNPNTLNPSILGQYQDPTTELNDIFNIQLNQLQDSVNYLGTETKLSREDITYTVKLGGVNQDDEVIQVYGFTEKQVNDSDTYDSLAKEFYGDTDYASAIAVYNHNKEVLKAGDTVYIPILSKAEATQGNEIFDSPDNKDNYGHDIKININGDFDIFDTDITVTGNEETINQAIVNRLTTAMDSRIKLNFYGIKSSIGKPQESIMYLKSSIESTIKDDPRIRSLDSLKLQGSGDNVIIHLIYTDINNNKVNYGGTI